MKSKLFCVGVCLSVSLISTGCLKTRAQLRDDGGNDQAESAPAKGVQTQVQDVQPQGAYVIDEIKSEMTRLNGRIEDLERAQKEGNATKQAAAGEDQKKLEARIVELETAQAQMLEALNKMKTEATPADPSEAFEKGRSQFDAGNFETAIEQFTAYLKSPKASKVETATFLRAESYYSLKQYKKAIVDYSKFPEKFLKSSRMPAALYKIGLSFEALGMKDDAKGFYQELAEKYPKSPEAKRIKAKLR